MAKGRGLGKGLDALLGDTTPQGQEKGTLNVPISKVQPGLDQPRKRFNQESIQALADSIQENGVLQPLTVRHLESGYYQIIAGERRWRAAKEAGLAEVPVIIIEADDRKVMELGLIENLQREDLNPIEEANGYLKLKTGFGLTQEEIAQRMGKSRSAIANSLRLTELSPAVQKLVIDGDLTAGHARALLALETGEQQEVAAQKIIVQGMNVRQTEDLVKKMLKTSQSPEEEETKKEQNIYLKELENHLSNRWGRKISIVPGRKKGKIQLEYYDSEDLENLLNQLKTIEAKKL